MKVFPIWRKHVLFTPSAITTSLWLDGADSNSVTLTSGFVSAWNDKSGNNNHAIQNTATNRPSYSNNAIVFDGINDYLQTGANATLNTDTLSWFAVFDYDGLSSETKIMFRSSYTSGASTNSNRLLGIYNQNSFFFTYSRNSSGTIKAVTYPSSTNQAILSTVWDSTNTISAWFNGSIDGSDPPTLSDVTATPSGHQFIAIGTDETLERYFWSGKINELIIIPSDLSTANRQRIEGYLAHKWGLDSNLPIIHPYKNNPPYL